MKKIFKKRNSIEKKQTKIPMQYHYKKKRRLLVINNAPMT